MIYQGFQTFVTRWPRFSQSGTTKDFWCAIWDHQGLFLGQSGNLGKSLVFIGFLGFFGGFFVVFGQKTMVINHG